VEGEGCRQGGVQREKWCREGGCREELMPDKGIDRHVNQFPAASQAAATGIRDTMVTVRGLVYWNLIAKEFKSRSGS
jgi:hypothetical protein